MQFYTNKQNAKEDPKVVQMNQQWKNKGPSQERHKNTFSYLFEQTCKPQRKERAQYLV